MYSEIKTGRIDWKKIICETDCKEMISLNRNKAERKKTWTRGLALAVACIMVFSVVLAALLRV